MTSSMSNPINQQTGGELVIDSLNGHIMAGGLTIAATYDLRHDSTGEEERANRRLLAASYSAFDKAGRELGIDAVKLAQLDLVAMVRALAGPGREREWLTANLPE